MQKLGIKKIYKPAKLKTRKVDLVKNRYPGGQKNKNYTQKLGIKGI